MVTILYHHRAHVPTGWHYLDIINIFFFVVRKSGVGLVASLTAPRHRPIFERLTLNLTVDANKSFQRKLVLFDIPTSSPLLICTAPQEPWRGG